MYAQNIEETEHKHEGTNHLGFGVGMSHLINENVWVPAVHLHYGKSLGEKQRFSIGAGLELLMDDHKHMGVVLAMAYKLAPVLTLGYGPGLGFTLAKEAEKDIHLGHHLKIAYEFDLDFIHLGPMVEYGFSKEDQHVMVGIHGGFSF